MKDYFHTNWIETDGVKDRPSSLKHLFLYINTFCDKIRHLHFYPLLVEFLRYAKRSTGISTDIFTCELQLNLLILAIDISYFIYTFYNPTKPINECYLIQIIWLNYIHFLKNPEGAHKALLFFFNLNLYV